MKPAGRQIFSKDKAATRLERLKTIMDRELLCRGVVMMTNATQNALPADQIILFLHG